jgi:hypothetical protein
MTRYRYRFTELGETGWWEREEQGVYLPPVSLEHPELREYLRAHALID